MPNLQEMSVVFPDDTSGQAFQIYIFKCFWAAGGQPKTEVVEMTLF
jgi:hypothetical protein